MTALAAIRRANQPGPPENSLRLRVACAATVIISIAAAVGEHEMAATTGLIATGLFLVGMAFSYRTRARPPGWIKIVVALAAVSALVWFVHQMSAGSVTDITVVENPLTVLFAAILVVHSFHVPARRDLLFALAASAALIAIAAAQAIDLSFGIYVVVWIACILWAMLEMWSSASDGGRIPVARVVTSATAVGVVSALAFLVLPAPVVAVRVDFTSRAGSGGTVGVPGALAGDAGSPAQLSKRGSVSGPTRIGGYLGFAGSLDTAVRGSLSHALVMRVRAQRPTYWVGETFDQWDGQSWNSTIRGTQTVGQGSPFYLPASDDLPSGQLDLQTFYISSSTANLIFHADAAREVWFPANNVYYSQNDSIVSPIGMGRGAVYTVESDVNDATADQLRQAVGRPPGELASVYTELPHTYAAAAALAQSVTSSATNDYDRVQDLITWIGDNTRYSTDIPPLPPGADSVNEFLFGNRVGFCEQISTALAVMLRGLGIPAREVVGYVPGSYNPVTDLYEVRADDAHAWVQVYFPGYGWQSFDPTAVVPLANPSPGATAVKDVTRALKKLPLLPLSLVVAIAVLVVVSVRFLRSRPATWAEKAARRIERAGRRRGRPRRVGETLSEYAAVLDGSADDGWRRLAEAAEASAYGDHHPPPAEQRELLKVGSSRARPKD
jgi:transglutaminase-like putative cysteine protease